MDRLPAVIPSSGLRSGCRRGHSDPVHVDVQFLGGHLRQRGEDALAELDLAGPDLDRCRRADPQPVAKTRVGRQCRRQRFGAGHVALPRISAAAASTARTTRLCDAAAAQVVVEGGAHIGVRRVGILGEQPRRRAPRSPTCSIRTARLADSTIERATGCGSPSAPRPSIVVTSLPSTAQSGVSHEYVGCPSTRTRQAPHTPKPAAEPGALQAEMVAQDVQKCRVGLGVDLLGAAVHPDGRGCWHLFCHIPELPARARRASKIDHTAGCQRNVRQVELTPGTRPSRNASTKCRWSSRTVAA